MRKPKSIRSTVVKLYGIMSWSYNIAKSQFFQKEDLKHFMQHFVFQHGCRDILRLFSASNKTFYSKCDAQHQPKLLHVPNVNHYISLTSSHK